MKAMILAAGLGTRLRPLTNDRPKALVEVAGQTLLEITLRRLREFGVREVIVNVHHFGEMVVEYLKKNDNFGMRIEISREEILLDTGGGLKQAAWFFQETSSSAEEPFLLHNVDVISTIDLGRMLEFHRANQALATLAVQHRETSRYLLFDEQHQLCGRRAGRDGAPEIVRPAQTSSPELKALAFSGIHVISSRFLSMMEEEGALSIIATYLRLAARGEKILAFSADEYYWRDLGKPENVERAAQDVEQNVFRLCAEGRLSRKERGKDRASGRKQNL
jgi:mannose-1-phosphate guanylyltransferase